MSWKLMGKIKGIDGKTPIAGVDFSIPKDGKDADEIKIIEKIKSQIPIPKNGSPDTPEEIVKKLNKTEESIKISVIKGLETQIKNILSSLREKKGGGGGGLGLPIHQTFNGNGSTTTFTLSNNVAANGNALWAYYQGQFLVKTTHWTISGKTLTLTFTPENNTNIDITYIRT